MDSLAARGAVVVLSGPPCAGKTTFARQNALEGDEILDWDEVFAEVSGLRAHVHPPEWEDRVGVEFLRRARGLRRGWFISNAPERRKRAMLRRITGGRSLILATSAETCLRRLDASDRPAAVKTAQRVVVAAWWQLYEPSTTTPECVLREDDPGRETTHVIPRDQDDDPPGGRP